jgi:hypothetical protein
VGKGLSQTQKRVMEEIEKNNCLTLYQVATIYRGYKRVGNEHDMRIYGYSKLIPDVTGLYRMMDSLEKRGLVASLLHRRPRVWYRVTWTDDVPHIADDGEHGGYINYEINMKQKCDFKTKNQTWRYKV